MSISVLSAQKAAVRNTLRLAVRVRTLLLVFVSSSLCAAVASAQPEVAAENSAPQSEDSTEVTPPRAVETKIDAPAQATELVEVVLELVIGVDGRVVSSKAIEGREPFRSAAEAASLKFTFAPATRGKAPIASKVRFLVRFEPSIEQKQQEPIAEAAPVARTQPSARAPKTAPSELEVTVPGTRTTVISTRISRVEAREIPGTFGDPLRAVETNPGVVPMYTGVPFFFIRGAPPGSVGYYIDGVKIPLLYHALAGPSVIHPGLIDHVDIYRGAAPARYGGTAGATIAAESREPLPAAGGEANLRIFDVGGLVEKPFIDGRLHVLAGGRYSYTALIASLLSGATLEYWDYQSRISYDFNHRNRLTLTVFGAYDKFEANSDNSLLNSNAAAPPGSNGSTASSDKAGANLYGGGLQFHRLDVREDYFGTRTRARFAVTAGYDRTSTTTGYLRAPILTSRSLIEYRVTPELSVAAGHDSSVGEYSLEVPTTVAGFDVLRGLFPNRRDLSLGGHVEATWSPAPFVSVTPGARADTYRSGDDTTSSIDGRMTAVIFGNRHIRAIETLGTSHQPPGFVPQIPAAQLGSLKGGLQSTLQFSSGIVIDVSNELSASVTAFEAQYRNLIDPIGQNRSLDLTTLDVQEILNLRTPGKAMGLEFELRRTFTHRLGGFISYTLSRNDRIVGGHSSLSGYDRPHVIQCALGYDLGRQWRAGARVMAYSGIPAKQLLNDGSGAYIYDSNHRAPTFARLDLRLEKRWLVGQRSYWAVVAEMLNATLSKEVTSLTCSIRCRQDISGPVSIPSIGLEFYSY